MEFVAAFFIFVLAVAGMAVGVIFSDRKLQGSCGGVAADGTTLGDCLCEKKKQNLCPSEEGNELVKMAGMGWPKRKAKGAPSPATSGDSIEV